MLPVGPLHSQHGLRGVCEHRVVPPGGEQLALSGRHVLAVEAFDAADDQPGSHVVALAARGERGEADLGDLGVGDPALTCLVPDRLGVADRGPVVVGDRGDRANHGRVHPGGDREVRPAAAGGGDHVVGVERRVSARASCSYGSSRAP